MGNDGECLPGRVIADSKSAISPCSNSPVESGVHSNSMTDSVRIHAHRDAQSFHSCGEP